MLIVCPQCGFSRDVSKDRLHGNSVIVHCPKCACRFRFSSSGLTEILSPKEEKRSNEADKSVARPPAASSAAAQDEDEDIRVIATRAYAREAARFQNEQDQISGQNPWEEAPSPAGWINALYQTILRVMFAPQFFFRALKPDAALSRALIFFLIFCIGQIIIEKIWIQVFISFLAGHPVDDPQMQQLLALIAPDTNLFLSIFVRVGISVGELYCFSFLMCLAYRLVAPKRASFPLVFQIMAYSSAPSILCIIPFIGSLAGFFWGLGCLAIGIKSALNLDWPKVCVGFLPIIILFAPFFSSLMGKLG